MSTKKEYVKLWIVRIIDFVILIGPLAYYIGINLASIEVKNGSKITMIAALAIAAIITVFNLLAQKHLRSPIWILFLGVYAMMSEILPLIIAIAIATILDEFIFSPLIKYYKTSAIANHALDKRLKKAKIIQQNE